MRLITLIVLVTTIISNTIDYKYGKIKFEKHERDSFQVTIMGTFNTFVGLLYGKSMTNSDVNVVEFLPKSNQTKYTIYDGWSSKYGRPNADEELGGTNDLYVFNYKIENDRPIITFTRKLTTSDRYDKDIREVIFFYFLEK
jgi:hypothetical protein